MNIQLKTYVDTYDVIYFRLAMKELLITCSFRANMAEEHLPLILPLPAPIRDPALQCIKTFYLPNKLMLNNFRIYLCHLLLTQHSRDGQVRDLPKRNSLYSERVQDLDSLYWHTWEVEAKVYQSKFIDIDVLTWVLGLSILTWALGRGIDSL